MTLSQRQTYSAVYLRWHTQQERTARRLVLVRMQGLAVRVNAQLVSSSPEAVMGALPVLIAEAGTRQLLETLYTRVGVAAAEREYERLKPAPTKAQVLEMLAKERDAPDFSPPRPGPAGRVSISFNSEIWKQRMLSITRGSTTAARITQITDHTRLLVRDVLLRGIEQRWDVRKIGRTITATLGGLAGRARALLIARTETTRAANLGHELGATSTGLRLNKIWIAAVDSRTRDSHLAAGRLKPIGRDELFSVGGRLMRFPGDPAGGAAEICNCRCSVAYVPAGNIFDN